MPQEGREPFNYREAHAIAVEGKWRKWDDETIVRFQLYQDRLCMDFSRFHEAVEKVLGRSVWTHEFAWPELLRAEYEGTRTAPTIDEIIGMIPPEKLIMIMLPDVAEKRGTG